MAVPDRAWLERMLEAAERGIGELSQREDARARVLLEDLYAVRRRLLDWLGSVDERDAEE
jgi:hypothetical protein